MSSDRPPSPRPPLAFAPVPSEPPPQEKYERLPGLYRRWELQDLIEPGQDHRFDPAGHTSDGVELFAVYRSKPIERRQQTTAQAQRGH